MKSGIAVNVAVLKIALDKQNRVNNQSLLSSVHNSCSSLGKTRFVKWSLMSRKIHAFAVEHWLFRKRILNRFVGKVAFRDSFGVVQCDTKCSIDGEINKP